MLGVVNLDKPVGPTSHDMVGLVRRLTGMRRIGHAGTLDPLASGVLPILVGAATRFSEELTGGWKRYEALIRLGWRSATDDGEGPLEPGGPTPPVDVATSALDAFRGTFEQRPPAFSARKIAGRIAHRAARAGEELPLPARSVTVDRLELIEAMPRDDHLDLRVDLRCGAGTYVRSIARDLGEQLGCGGYLAALRRTEAAGLSVEGALAPSRLEELAASGRLGEALLPIEVLLRLPRVELDPIDAERFRHGSRLQLAVEGAPTGRHAIFAGTALLGIGTIEAGVLQPEKVVSEAAP
jgi:tRNA pseudouridine55 synthase